MCTLTIISTGEADSRRVRIECNRDESRLRPGAKPPEQRTCGERQVLMPVDPLSDGTWIGVSDAGVAAVLMNVYIAQTEKEIEILPRTRPLISRGTIIPHVLAASDVADAIERFKSLNPRDFEPFRLILVDRAHWLEIVWAAEQLSIDPIRQLDEPLFFTSSGLGDDIVATPRRELFDEMLARGEPLSAAHLAAAQDAFHRHVWPGREFASVWMTRPEARTQSITWCELTASDVTMRYAARDWGDRLEMAEPIALPIRNG
jgi:uncharacterized protein with NRDE domain